MASTFEVENDVHDYKMAKYVKENGGMGSFGPEYIYIKKNHTQNNTLKA